MLKVYKLVFVEEDFLTSYFVLFEDYCKRDFSNCIEWFSDFIDSMPDEEYKIECYFEGQEFPYRVEYFNGREYHNRLGPAILRVDNSQKITYVQYYLDGYPHSQEEWFKKLNKQEQINALFHLNEWKEGEKRI